MMQPSVFAWQELQAGTKNLANPLIRIIQRGFAIAAALAKFPGNASADPVQLHDMHSPAAGADALELRFPSSLNSGRFIKIVVEVLYGFLFVFWISIRLMPCHLETPIGIALLKI
jgi:hypothetical protein